MEWFKSGTNEKGARKIVEEALKQQPATEDSQTEYLLSEVMAPDSSTEEEIRNVLQQMYDQLKIDAIFIDQKRKEKNEKEAHLFAIKRRLKETFQDAERRALHEEKELLEKQVNNLEADIRHTAMAFAQALDRYEMLQGKYDEQEKIESEN